MKIIKVIDVKGLDGKTVTKAEDQLGRDHLGMVRYRLGYVIT